MKLERFLLYELAALSGLYVLAVLYAIPIISGLLDDSMEGTVRPWRLALV